MRVENKEAGKELNSLYEKFVTDPNNEEAKNRLFEEIDNFARRITAQTAGSKVSYLNNTVTDEHTSTDISQSVALKVWQNLEKFESDSKFSTWVYQVVKNTVLDSVRQIGQRREVDLLEWRANDAPSAGFRGSATGAAPAGAIDLEDDVADGDGGGHVRRPILTGNYLGENEDGISSNLDFEKAFKKLSNRDQQIVGLFRDGHKAAEIGKEFSRDAKWASNQLTRLKELLKHELYIAETILHSCKRSVQPTTVLEEGRFYTGEGDGYCSLPLCRCKKRLTGLEAKVLVQNGEAHPIYKIKDGQPVVVRQEVWAQQSIRVPRVGLNSNSADIERAYIDGNQQSKLDIEIAHKMDVTFLKSLIVPFRPDPWEGRTLFTGFTDERTSGGHQDSEGVPSAEDVIWKKGGRSASKSLISNVLVLEGAASPSIAVAVAA